MAGGWIYMMTNRRNGTLYVGVTSMLPKRAYEHREGVVEGFTQEHGLKRLVYYEWHDTIQSAIQREKNIKHCRAPGRCGSFTQ
jgi:putative endonuclease